MSYLKLKKGTYTYYSGDGDFHHLKIEAQKDAQKERGHGRIARVIKVKGGYRVYSTSRW